MPLGFPPNPNVGDVFVASNGTSYRWDGEAWVARTSGLEPAVTVGVNPPGSPAVGDLWFQSTNVGRLFIFVDGAWIDASPAPPPAGGGSGSGSGAVLLTPDVGVDQTIVSPDPADIPLTLEGAAAQTGDLLLWTDDAQAPLGRIDSSGHLQVGAYDPGLATTGARVTNGGLNASLAAQGRVDVFGTTGPTGDPSTLYIELNAGSREGLTVVGNSGNALIMTDVGGDTPFRVDGSGLVTVQDLVAQAGSAAAPSIGFSSTANLGFHDAGTNRIGLSVQGVLAGILGSSSSLTGGSLTILTKSHADALYAPVSSRRYKDDIGAPSIDALAMQFDYLEPRIWQWGGELSEVSPRRGAIGIGFVAEELEAVTGAVVHRINDAGQKEVDGLDAFALIAVLTARIRKLEGRLALMRDSLA